MACFALSRDRWRALRSLAPAERRVLAAAMLLLPATAAGVRLVGMKRWQAVLDALARATSCRRQVGSPRVVELVDQAARHLPLRVLCLPRSMVTCWLLRWQGHAAELRIGVRRTGNRLQAHAWAEQDGRPIDGGAEMQWTFTPFARPVD